MSRQHQTRTSSQKSSSGKEQPRFTAPPVIQPKAATKPKTQLPEWKPGGSGVNPLAGIQQTLQAKLTIGQPNDRYEQEADRVARNVVQRLNSPVSDTPQQEETVQRETEDRLQTKPLLQRQEAIGGGEASTELESSINRAKSGGQPLDSDLQQSMGQAMGADFSSVRVHTDSQSDTLNQSIQAKAFTTGQNVFFRQGAYQPGSQSGQELIAHELTHVVQQNGSRLQRKGEERVTQKADPNAVQRAAMIVDKQKYEEPNILRVRNAVTAMYGDYLYPLFNNEDGKLWKFASPMAFYVFLSDISRANWDGNMPNLPNEVTVYRRDPKQSQVAGRVIVKNVEYASADDLKEALFSLLIKVKDTLFDNKLLKLLRDPLNRWKFAQWGDVDSALNTWNGEAPYSENLQQYRIPTRPDTKLSKWDPSQVTENNAQEIESTFNNIWEVCGQTAEYMIARLHDLQGDVTLEYEKELSGLGGAQELANILTGDVNKLSLINIGNRLIHEFTIEKRPSDQAAILHQAYIGAYNSLWWAGLEENLISLSEEPKEAISKMRDEYGKGQQINLGKLKDNLSAFMSAPSIDDEAALEAWQKLPFHPMSKPNSEEPPNLLVRVWHVNAPQTILDTLQSMDEWVTTAVQKEVQEVYQKILQSKMQ